MPNARERAAAKAAKYAENRAKWQKDPRNSNYQYEQASEALVSEIVEPASEDLRSIDRLRAIMRDNTVAIGRRTDCAEVLLGYELPAAALAQATTEPVTSEAYLFLKGLTDTPSAPELLRFRALRALSAIEAAKPLRVDPQQKTEQRRRIVDLVNAARRMELVAAGTWHTVCISGQDWGLLPGDEFTDPDLRPSEPMLSISAALDGALARPEAERQSRRERRREALLQIAAENRDDNWRRWLNPVAAAAE